MDSENWIEPILNYTWERISNIFYFIPLVFTVKIKKFRFSVIQGERMKNVGKSFSSKLRGEIGFRDSYHVVKSGGYAGNQQKPFESVWFATILSKR